MAASARVAVRVVGAEPCRRGRARPRTRARRAGSRRASCRTRAARRRSPCRSARRAGGAGARADLRGCRAPRARSGAPAPSRPRARTRAPRRSAPRRRGRGSRSRPRATHRQLVGDRGDEHAQRPGAGSRRMRSTPTCTAPMKRIQFSCLAKRPARRGLPATTTGSRRRAASVAPAITSAIQASVELEQRRLDREAEHVRSGSATKPLSRSIDDRRERDVAGAGGLRGAADAEDVAADRRRQHVADELAGEVVAEQRAQRDVRRRTPRAPAASARPRARSRRA